MPRPQRESVGTARASIPAAPGVTGPAGADAGPAPIALLATTVQLTAVPFARPATTIGAPAPEALCTPQVAV